MSETEVQEYARAKTAWKKALERLRKATLRPEWAERGSADDLISDEWAAGYVFATQAHTDERDRVRLADWRIEPDADVPELYLRCETFEQQFLIMHLLGASQDLLDTTVTHARHVDIASRIASRPAPQQ